MLFLSVIRSGRRREYIPLGLDATSWLHTFPLQLTVMEICVSHLTE